METPSHERRQIEDYLCSQSGDDFEIEHVEKLVGCQNYRPPSDLQFLDQPEIFMPLADTR
jgi:hypothetical protein